MKTADVQEGSFGLELAPGSIFGNYEIVRKLGEGGMGAVFEARRQGLNKRVALKVLTLGGNPSVTARFVQEARISASLEHPHVADCFDVGEVDGLPFLALEFLDGETLGARLERGPMTLAEIVDIALPVCSALWAAHRKGIVHRDLKPDNIFLARQVGVMVTKVLDFGIAKARNGNEPQGLTRTASIMGTPGYMSPEQAKDSKNVGAATDHFALGVILWEAVTGRALYHGESALDVLMKVVSEAAPPLRALCPAVDPDFESLVARLLEKDPNARLGSMQEVGAALLPFASPEARARWTPEFVSGLAAPSPRPSAAPIVNAPTIRDPSLAPTIKPSPTPLALPKPLHRRRASVAVAAVVGVLGLSSLAAWRAARSDAGPSAVAAPPTVTTASTLAAPTRPPAPPASPSPPASPAPAAPAPQAVAAPVVADDPGAQRRGRPGRPPRHGRGARRRRPID